MSSLPRWLYPLSFVALAACGQGAVSSSPEVVPGAATATVIPWATPTAPSMAAPLPTNVFLSTPAPAPLSTNVPTPTATQAPAPTPELPPELTAGIDALIACAGRDETYWLEHGAPILTPELVQCVAEELGGGTMKYVLGMAVLFMALAASPLAAWTPPDDCADEDREIPGNRRSQCKLTLPDTLEDVTYDVMLEFPTCVEEISFSAPGARSTENDLQIKSSFSRFDPQQPTFPWGYFQPGVRVSPGRVHLRGYEWGVTDSITGSSFMWQFKSPLETMFRIGVDVRENSWYSTEAEGPMPDVSGVVDLANSCLDLVQQEMDDLAQAADLKRQEAEAAARLAAQEDADRKALEQAQREAETQAKIAEQERAAALESKTRAAKEELLRTETVQAQIKHEEAIAVILRDIVGIRLAGQEDRARLTNDYLVRLESAQADFDVETSEIETRIQQYFDFNAQLLARIEEYQQSIDARLEEAETAIAEQRAAIEELAQEEGEAAAPVEEGAQ